MWPNNGFGNGQNPNDFIDPNAFFASFPMFPPSEGGFFQQMMNNMPSPDAMQLGFAQNQNQAGFMQNQNLPSPQVSSWIWTTN
jgi:hypothetical protein